MKSNARALSTAGPAREICASSVVARGIGSGGCGPHLHDRRSVVGDGGDALVVVDELVEPAGTLRARSGWGAAGWSGGQREIRKQRKRTVGAPAADLARRSEGRRTRVVRMESTTAMHALMLEISWPLPWLVSVPSRRSTIWGCCGGGDGERASGRCAIARSPALSKTTRRARERGGTREGESRADRAGGGGSGGTRTIICPLGICIRGPAMMTGRAVISARERHRLTLFA